MLRYRLAWIGLAAVALVAVVVFCATVPSILAGRLAFMGAAGHPRVFIGPKSVLLKTPNAQGNGPFEISVSVSPDGQTVAAGRIESEFGKAGENPPSATVVSVLDLTSNRERLTITNELDENCSVAFAPDGKTLAVGLGGLVKLYDPVTGQTHSTLTYDLRPGFFALAFSADGQTLAAATLLGDVVTWNIASGQPIATFKAHTRSPNGVAISSDGQWVASASAGPIICHYSGPFGLPTQIFGVSSVGCGSDYGIVRLFSMTTKREYATLKHDGTVNSVSFSPDGKQLASCSDTAVKIWDLTTNKAPTVFRTSGALGASCVAYSPNGRTLAIGMASRDWSGSDGEVRLWDVEDGYESAVLKTGSGRVRSLAFTPDGNSLVSGSTKAVVLWDIASTGGARYQAAIVPALAPPQNWGVERRTLLQD